MIILILGKIELSGKIIKWNKKCYFVIIKVKLLMNI